MQPTMTAEDKVEHVIDPVMNDMERKMFNEVWVLPSIKKKRERQGS